MWQTASVSVNKISSVCASCWVILLVSFVISPDLLCLVMAHDLFDLMRFCSLALAVVTCEIWACVWCSVDPHPQVGLAPKRGDAVQL